MTSQFRFLADEDFDRRILEGVLRRNPAVEFFRAQDVGLGGLADETILEWAASEGCVLLSHDVSTMQGAASARITAGLPVPGVFLISQYLPIRRAIDEILLITECSAPDEWLGQVRFLPL